MPSDFCFVPFLLVTVPTPSKQDQFVFLPPLSNTGLSPPQTLLYTNNSQEPQQDILSISTSIVLSGPKLGRSLVPKLSPTYLLEGSFWRHSESNFLKDLPYFFIISLSSTPVSKVGGSFCRVNISTCSQKKGGDSLCWMWVTMEFLVCSFTKASKSFLGWVTSMLFP